MDALQLRPLKVRILLQFPTTALLLGLLLVVHPSAAFATTGPNMPTPARYKVPLRLAQPYRGQYSMVMADRGARFTDGAMAIDLNAIDYLYGVIEFRGYDSRGDRTSWVTSLYDFHLVAHGRMLVNLYPPGTDTVLLGRMSVTRLANGDLMGWITLDRHSYATRWHKNLNL
jgi:hypothetical protein